MQSVARAAVRSGRMGQPLPDIYPNLADVKTRFRRGGTSMLAGPPGSFKSIFALNLVCKWAAEGVSGFYVSADSDQHTVAKRCAAILSGDPADIVEQTLLQGAYARTLNRLSDFGWEYKAMDMNGIVIQIQAFEYMHGHLPDVVFVDNLMNCVDNPTDFSGQMTMVRDLDSLARDIKAHICILHHTSESYQGNSPPPRWAIQNKVSQIPRLILTFQCVQGRLSIATVKNTNGPQQSDGQFYRDFTVDLSNYNIEMA